MKERFHGALVFCYFYFFSGPSKNIHAPWPIDFTCGILSLGNNPKYRKGLSLKDVFVTLFRLAQNWKQFKCLNNWRMGKWVLIHSCHGLLHSHCNVCYEVYTTVYTMEKVLMRKWNVGSRIVHMSIFHGFVKTQIHIETTEGNILYW